MALKKAPFIVLFENPILIWSSANAEVTGIAAIINDANNIFFM
ncbi:hypothetical protein [Vibrio crassostreae]|nr:hypothetical protein [Vibrio crassostreae]